MIPSDPSVATTRDDVKRRPLFLVAEDTHDSEDARESIDVALLDTADPPSD